MKMSFVSFCVLCFSLSSIAGTRTIEGKDATQLSNAMIAFGTKSEVVQQNRRVTISGLGCAGDIDFQSYANCVTGIDHTYQGIEEGGTKASRKRSFIFVNTLVQIVNQSGGSDPKTQIDAGDLMIDSGMGMSYLNARQIVCVTSSLKVSFCEVSSDAFDPQN